MKALQTKLKEMLDYDPGTGIFVWKQTHRHGKVAGSLNNTGYIRIKFDGKLYQAHRLAWLYVHGEIPSGMIDHINRVRNDNRISNLRKVTTRGNCMNSVRKVGRSGVRGAVETKHQRFVSTISFYGRMIYLGTFGTKQEAHEAFTKKREQFDAQDTELI